MPLFNKIKQNLGVSYSVILLIIIPLIMIVNTVFFAVNLNKIGQNNIKQQITTRENLISSAISDSIYSQTLLKQKMDAIAKSDPKITEISVLKPTDRKFVIYASTDTQKSGQSVVSYEQSSSWNEGKTVRASLNDPNQSQYYNLSYIPLKDIDQNVLALAFIKIDLSDYIVYTKVNQSNVLMLAFVLIFLTILLLSSQFKMLEYAINYKKLQEVDKMKDDFISIASHELKTPMAGIKGYISMLAEGTAGKIDANAKKHLDLILENVQRLDILVEELLDVSRLEQKRMQFNVEAVDAVKAYKEIAIPLETSAKTKGISLNIEVPRDLPNILADKEKLQQVLNNIIGNAVKYTQKGSVTVKFEKVDDKFAIAVTDTGIGISPQNQKNLFQKFYRIKNEKTQDIAGTGLGLWISQQIIKNLNGTINVKSQEGIGSVFTITLPFAKE